MPTNYEDTLNLSDLDITEDGQPVAWWWIQGGTEDGEDVVWEPLYCKRHKHQARRLLKIILNAVDQRTPQATKEDLIYYDDFRVVAEVAPAASVRRQRLAKRPASVPEPPANAAPKVRSTKAAKNQPQSRKQLARTLIKEALNDV